MKLEEMVINDINNFLKENNRDLFVNERDFQMQLAVFLRNSSNGYKDVDVEYFIPASLLNKQGYSKIWTEDAVRIDIVVQKENEFFPIELKYKTKRLKQVGVSRFGEVIREEFEYLRNQGAQDLGMYGFWKDVKRIEVLKERFENINSGLVVFVTNDVFYKKDLSQKENSKESNNSEFRMNEGKHLKSKHWKKADSRCCRDYPNFVLDKEYDIKWDTANKSGVDLYYTILQV